MQTFLLACLRSNLTGSGGAGAFTIGSVNLTQQSAGTSCGHPFTFNVSLVYTGSPIGKTVKIERSFADGAYTTVATGVDPATAFPYSMTVDGYYDKFGVPATTYVRITDEANYSNLATSSAFRTTYTLCL